MLYLTAEHLLLSNGFSIPLSFFLTENAGNFHVFFFYNKKNIKLSVTLLKM